MSETSMLPLNWRELPAGPELNVLIWNILEKPPMFPEDVPSLSTSLDCAVEHLWDEMDMWSIGVSHHSDLALGKYCATGPGRGADYDFVCEFADTPALAICRAYLAHYELRWTKNA